MPRFNAARILVSLAFLAKLAHTTLERCALLGSCEECLAEGSGCFGWLGSECCSKDGCESAALGGRGYYTSCQEWRAVAQILDRCGKVPANDTCACRRIGCVAQETATGGITCSADLKPEGGREIGNTCGNMVDADHIEEMDEDNIEEMALEMQHGTWWCPDSEPNLCYPTACPIAHCPRFYCAMRLGFCCDYTCKPAPTRWCRYGPVKHCDTWCKPPHCGIGECAWRKSSRCCDHECRPMWHGWTGPAPVTR
mmetsp:Transcript_148991/g.371213  ORF Transcript_148991/g.371213 Transcript_148991/m.371213 type:complete len:253 (-) Transcript_148991:409-1167(-)